MGEVRVGTSGWNYPSGTGTWNGLFYPKTRSKRQGTDRFDELAFYAEHFDTVEVNSTFYGQPRADVTRGWASRTPSVFDFSLKLYQKFTHPKMFKAAALKSAPGSEGELLDLLAKVTQADIDDFRAGIEPLATAGKVGALLAQFPPSFKDSPQSRDYLAQLLRAFADYPIAVELRHKSWSDAIGDTRQERRPLQLPLYRRRTAGVFRNRERREGAGEEVVSLREQSLLVEVGRQRRDAEGATGSAHRR